MLEKFKALGNAAKWDSCGGATQRKKRSRIPAALENIVYDCSATSENCRLMKVLQTNSCTHDCKYCINSTKSNQKRLIEPKEMTDSFQTLWQKGWVNGLFLSSAVPGNAELIAEKMIESARLIREKQNYRGYIHLKVLPGQSKDQVFGMAKYADRLSLNIEAPSKSFLHELSSTKDFQNDLIKRLHWIDHACHKGMLPSKFTTQLIVGALDETDQDILKTMEKLYECTALHRTYFSAFQPIKNTKLESFPAENPMREHRLYQADWLLRVYGFTPREMKQGLNEQGNFNLRQDVKMVIAVNNENQFPLDPNIASLPELMKVPGIGPKTARKIVFAREEKNQKFKDLKELKKLGVITRRAQAFLQLEKIRQLKL